MRLLKLTQVSGSEVWVNVDHIVTISTAPNAMANEQRTFIDFSNPEMRLSVRQSADQIIRLLEQQGGGNAIR